MNWRWDRHHGVQGWIHSAGIVRSVHSWVKISVHARIEVSVHPWVKVRVHSGIGAEVSVHARINTGVHTWIEVSVHARSMVHTWMSEAMIHCLVKHVHSQTSQMSHLSEISHGIALVRSHVSLIHSEISLVGVGGVDRRNIWWRYTPDLGSTADLLKHSHILFEIVLVDLEFAARTDIHTQAAFTAEGMATVCQHHREALAIIILAVAVVAAGTRYHFLNKV